MEQYTVTGMSCAACSSRVEKAVSKVPGVTSCSVSLLTNSMGVEGTATSAQIIEAVENAGYGASLKGAANEKTGSAAGNNDDFFERQRYTSIEAEADCFFMFPYTTYVSVHGTYDVELAIARIYGGQSCGNGTGSVAFDYDCYGHQPEVLYQRI